MSYPVKKPDGAMKRAIVDVDGTLWDLHNPLQNVLHKLYSQLPKTLPTKWDWFDDYDVKPSQFYTVVNMVHELQTSTGTAKAYAGAKQLFKLLNDQKWEVIVASHRKYDTAGQLAGWLYVEGLGPYSGVYTGQDKKFLFREGDLVIDDAPDTILWAADKGCDVWYLAWPWNEGLPGQRAETLWQIIAGLVDKYG